MCTLKESGLCTFYFIEFSVERCATEYVNFAAVYQLVELGLKTEKVAACKGPRPLS
jgi:hypothetical protein